MTEDKPVTTTKKEVIAAYKAAFGHGFNGSRIKKIDGSYAAVVILEDKVRVVVRLNEPPENRSRPQNNDGKTYVRVDQVI
jgi:hypothetical protein